MLRRWLASLLIVALLLNTAYVPVAFADDKTPDQVAAEKRIDGEAAALDAVIDEEAKALPKSEAATTSVAALHAQNHEAQAEAKAEVAKQSVVARYFKSLDSAGWLRLMLGGFKAFDRASKLGAMDGGPLAIGAAVAIELGATVGEMPIGAALQNFPINTTKPAWEKRGLAKEIVATLQGSVNSTIVFWMANPALTQALSALHDSSHPLPTLYGAAMGFLAGIGQSAAYVVGYRGASNIENKGWISGKVKSILFALTGMVGFYAAMRMASGDPAQQASVFKMLVPLWGAYVATGIASIFVPKRKTAACPAAKI